MTLSMLSRGDMKIALYIHVYERLTHGAKLQGQYLVNKYRNRLPWMYMPQEVLDK